jgi:uncharacterized protein (TIGR02569 family)
VALKPVDDPRQDEWVCETYDAWPTDASIGVPRPLRTRDGSWSSDGWAAHLWVEGESASVVDDPVWFRRAVDGFHAMTASLPRPAFLDDRDDPWAIGDRVAFGEQEPVAARRFVDQALTGCGPAKEAPQVVHGDLTGNVLRTSDDRAVVIDWPPYFRPQGWALAVVATDAVCWQGADLSLLRDWDDVSSWPQLVRRALVYRVTTRALVEDDPDLTREFRVLEEVS